MLFPHPREVLKNILITPDHRGQTHPEQFLFAAHLSNAGEVVRFHLLVQVLELKRQTSVPDMSRMQFVSERSFVYLWMKSRFCSTVESGGVENNLWLCMNLAAAHPLKMRKKHEN